MYLSELDIIGISIAIAAQMMVNIILFISARRNRKQYLNAVRLYKRERMVRQFG